MTKEQLQQYRNWVIYQIYPRSFADSNGDGVGDLQGIISKLPYIKSLSVDGIWISPCYPSPRCDNGYDVSNYTDIAPEYGSLRDMDELIAKAHGVGIKVILDLVANHTSSKHAWFEASRQSKINPYAEYYYWVDQPLNDWKSVFTGKSAWIYEETREQYYLASFAPEQPDLNWENPAVRQEIQKVVDFWVARGVDGFRCDVLDMISKDFNSPNGNGNGPKLHAYIRELFDRDTTRNIFTVGECWGSSIENIRLFCGLDRGELSCSFQNDHREFGFKREDKFQKTEFSLRDVATALSKWQREIQSAEILYTLFWENHDSPRIISRFGDERLRYASGTMLATMLYLLGGVAFVYEGQELGLVNSRFWELSAYEDIESIAYFENHKEAVAEKALFERLNFASRDTARRMMPWSKEKTPTWIKTDERLLTYNVKAQESDAGSMLHFYRRLLAFRRENVAFSKGSYKELAITKDYYIYERAYNGKCFVVVCNFTESMNIEGLTGKIVLSNTGRKSLGGAYRAYECVVLEK